MRLRAWYVNQKCILVFDKVSDDDIHMQSLADLAELEKDPSSPFDFCMVFNDEVEIGESV